MLELKKQPVTVEEKVAVVMANSDEMYRQNKHIRDFVTMLLSSYSFLEVMFSPNGLHFYIDNGEVKSVPISSMIFSKESTITRLNSIRDNLGHRRRVLIEKIDNQLFEGGAYLFAIHHKPEQAEDEIFVRWAYKITSGFRLMQADKRKIFYE